jgi:hypothetical protein
MRRDFDYDLTFTLLKAHGLVMSIAFLIVFPLGALLVRSLKFKGSVWIHVACQMIGWVLMIAGLCLGERTGKMIFEVRRQFFDPCSVPVPEF